MSTPEPVTSTPLTGRLPTKLRHALYWAFALAGVVLGVCQILEVDTGKTAEVLAYLGIVIGSLAGSNVLSSPDA